MDLSSAVNDASIRMPEGIQGANVRPVLGGLRIVFNHLDIPSGLSGERIDARQLALVGFANRRLEVKDVFMSLLLLVVVHRFRCEKRN